MKAAGNVCSVEGDSDMDLLLRITEFIGIIAFAMSGAVVGIQKKLDLFGVCVLGITTALGGGLLRDMILGTTPPLMFTDFHFALLAFCTSIGVFLYFIFRKQTDTSVERLTNIINIPDAFGLAAFTVIGCGFAVEAGYGYNPFFIIFIGTTTGVGGGVFRDVFVARIPYILKKHVYAMASIVGAVVFYIIYHIGMDSIIAMVAGAITVLVIRLSALANEWNLPKIHF